MEIRRRITGILISLALMIVMMPAAGMSMKAYADDEVSYNLWVGEEEVTSEHTGGEESSWYYEPDEKTLYLNAAVITKGHEVDGKKYGIYYSGSDGLTIVSIGNINKIGSGSDPLYTGIASTDKNAKVVLFDDSELNVSGTYKGIEIAGDLTIVNGNVKASGGTMGISGGKDVTVESGAVNAYGGTVGIYAEEGSVNIKSGTVSARSDSTGGYGIQTLRGSVTIDNGVVNAASNNIAIYAKNGSVNINYGQLVASGKEKAIEGTVKNIFNGVGWDSTEETTNGKAITVSSAGRELKYKKVEFAAFLLWVGGVPVTDTNLSGKGWKYDPHSNTLTLSGANITTGYNLDGPLVYGIYYSHRKDTLNLVLEEGTVNTISGASIHGGIHCPDAKLSISGKGTLIVTGNRTGIYSRGMDIKDAAVTAVSDNNVLNSAGMESNGSLTVKSGTVNAAGSVGIKAKGGITIESGTVTATGSATETVSKSGSDGSGILAGEAIDIKGGKVNATGSGKNGYGLRSDYDNVIIGENSFLTAAGATRAIYVNTDYSKVKNEIVGVGWTNRKGTEGETTIDISKKGQDLSRFRKVEFPAYAGEPDDDAASDDSGSASAGTKGVNTGDENNIVAWTVLMAAALTGAAGMAFARKKRDSR